MKNLTFKLGNKIGDITLDINKIISEHNDSRKQIISEAFTKTDVKEIERIVRKELKDEFLDSIQKKIEETIKSAINGKDNEKIIMEIAQNILIQFLKQLWVRRNAWKGLKNRES